LNDGWLWVKTRFDLAAADDLRDSTINVDVDQAVVTLTGTVASAAQKTRAEQVAKAVEDVKSVRNQLKVAPSGANANGNANRNVNKKTSILVTGALIHEDQAPGKGEEFLKDRGSNFKLQSVLRTSLSG
jgi:hypothetical protein